MKMARAAGEERESGKRTSDKTEMEGDGTWERMCTAVIFTAIKM